MGILKDAIRKVLTEEAQRTGRDIRFIDTPTQVIETAKQAKQHDMELVEKPKDREYAPIAYAHNPYAELVKSSVLFLYVRDMRKDTTVAYIAFTECNIDVCRGCSFGQYNMWRDGASKVSYGRNYRGLKEATEFFERIYAADHYQIIITSKGKQIAEEIMKGGGNGNK